MNSRRIAAAGATGLAATAPMTGWMLTGQLVSRHGEQPPKRVVRTLGGRAGIPSRRRGLVTVLVTAAAHAGFGAACGALYGAVVSRSNPMRGAAFGIGIWATSYAGWIPAMDIMPPPRKDAAGRAWTILTAHVVYGSCLGAGLARYDQWQAARRE